MSAQVNDIKITASHDGIAETLLVLKYDNGGISQVTLDYSATTALMEACKAKSIDDIIGASWDKVRDAIQASYKR